MLILHMPMIEFFIIMRICGSNFIRQVLYWNLISIFVFIILNTWIAAGNVLKFLNAIKVMESLENLNLAEIVPVIRERGE